MDRYKPVVQGFNITGFRDIGKRSREAILCPTHQASALNPTSD